MPISPTECLSPTEDTDSFFLFCEILDNKLREEFTGAPLQLIRMNYPGVNLPPYSFSRKVIDAYNAEKWNVLLVEEDDSSYFDLSPMLTTKISNETILK